MPLSQQSDLHKSDCCQSHSEWRCCMLSEPVKMSTGQHAGTPRVLHLMLCYAMLCYALLLLGVWHVAVKLGWHKQSRAWPHTLRPLMHRSQKCSLCCSSSRRLSKLRLLNVAPFTSGCVKLHRDLCETADTYTAPYYKFHPHSAVLWNHHV